MLKCLEMMKEVEVEVSRKKSASRKVKDLKEAIAAASNDQADLEAQQQHFKRQMATLSDRIKRLESQVRGGGAIGATQRLPYKTFHVKDVGRLPCLFIFPARNVSTRLLPNMRCFWSCVQAQCSLQVRL